MQSLQLLVLTASKQLVEGMEVPLTYMLLENPRLLQQVAVDVSTNRIPLEIEVDVHVLAKAAGVVVAIGAGIAKGFEHTGGLEEHILHPLHLSPLAWVGDSSNVLHDVLAGFCLPCPTLP